MLSNKIARARRRAISEGDLGEGIGASRPWSPQAARQYESN
jgi:hypothetical protein